MEWCFGSKRYGAARARLLHTPLSGDTPVSIEMRNCGSEGVDGNRHMILAAIEFQSLSIISFEMWHG
ncbi:MAG TPA: hypothetical protein VME68_09295 [Acidobacteriaceae bacterium]|nr:hypothetical protein [Acidobacteriaceae bacterium]